MEFKLGFWKYCSQDGESRYRLQKIHLPSGRWVPARGIDLVQEVLITGRVITYLVERTEDHKDGVKIPIFVRSSNPFVGAELRFRPYKGVYSLVRLNRLPAKGVYLNPDEGFFVISDGVINSMTPVIG